MSFTPNDNSSLLVLTTPGILGEVSRHVFNIKFSQLRAARRLTMEGLATIAKVSSATVYRAENKPPSVLRPLVLENLLCGLHEASPLKDDEIDEMLALAGFTASMSLQTKRRMQQLSSAVAAPVELHTQQNESDGQIAHTLLDFLLTRAPARTVQARLQQLITEFKPRDDTMPPPQPGMVAIEGASVDGLRAKIYQPVALPDQPPSPTNRKQQGTG